MHQKKCLLSMPSKKSSWQNISQECVNAQLSTVRGFMDTRNPRNPQKNNVANKFPLFNDFLEFKFQDDIQARIL